MKISIPLLIVLFVVASICRAEEPARVASRKISDCTVPDVIGIRMYESDMRIDGQYPSSMALLEKMKALVEKVPDPKRPVGEQLSGKDNEEFGEIRSRLLSLNWRRLIESRYSKHLQLIEKMTESVDAKYRWGRDPDEKSVDYMADVTPAILQEVSPINTFDPPKEDHCTLIWALHLQERTSLTALNDPELDAAATKVKQLQQKYHVSRVDRKALSRDDQYVFDEAQATLVRMQREAVRVQQIEQIKLLAEASDIIYDASIKDFERSAGDPGSSINTLQQMKKDGKISDQLEMRINVWSKLDEKYPSAEAAGLESIKKAAP